MGTGSGRTNIHELASGSNADPVPGTAPERSSRGLVLFTFNYRGNLYINNAQVFERIDKKKTTDIEVRNYFVTTNFSTKNFAFEDSDVFKDKNLFNKKNTILTEYWNDSGLVPTDEEKSIIEAIGKL